MRLAWAVLSAFAAAGLANAGKVSRDINAATPPGSPVPVIVQYLRTPGTAERNDVSGAGGWIKRELHSIRGLAAVVPPAQLERLAADPRVATVLLPVRDGMTLVRRTGP